MDKIFGLKECVDKITKDAYKFFVKNNKAAGVRTRKKLQKCRKYAQEIRKLIQKSKQELVQKKAAAAANAAALNTDKFFSCDGNETNKSKAIPIVKDHLSSYNFVNSKNNELTRSLTKENSIIHDFAKNIPSIQEYSRIESLPSLDGNQIDILR